MDIVEQLSVHELIWGYMGAVAILGGGVTYLIKKHLIQRFLMFLRLMRKPDPTEAHMAIKKMLIQLRVETKADRAHIVQFHNGDYYDNQSSIKRFTYCYEDIKNGVSSTSEKYQRRLVSGYIDGLSKLVDDEKPVNKLSFHDLESCLYKGKMIEDGIHMQIGIPLRGKVKGSSRVVGYIVLSYNTDREEEVCAFHNLVEEGHFINSDTDALQERACNGICKDCRFQRYIPQFEQALKNV